MNDYKYLKIAIFSLMGIVVLLVGLGIYVNYANNLHIANIMAKSGAVNVTVMKKKETDICPVFDDLDINIKAKWSIDVTASMEGNIEGVYFNEGTNVQEGDILYYLRNDSLSAQLVASEAEIEASRVNLANYTQIAERYRQLVESNAISVQDYESAKATRDAAKAHLDSMVAKRDSVAAQIEKLTVRAPRDAVVLRLYKKYGDYARVGESLCMLADMSDMKMMVSVPIETSEQMVRCGEEPFFLEIPSYQLSNKATNFNTDKKDISDNGHIFFKAYLLQDSVGKDVVDKVCTVEWSVNDEKNILMPIFYQDVRLFVKKNYKVWALPKRSVYNLFGGKSYVFVVNDKNVLEKRFVSTGISDAENIEIIHGLESDDKVVVSKHVHLEEGLDVYIRKEVARDVQ